MIGLLSKIYQKFVAKRNTGFDKESKEIIKASVPVISVGNLSAGGTGKTPFVEFLMKILLQYGHKPAIIGKGYKRKSKGDVIVSDGKEILLNVDDAGDEMYMLAGKFKVPVISAKSKSDAAVMASDKFDIDCIIIDDGFQHRRLHRDIDILLLDQDTLDNPDLIPKGRLREPLNSIERADIICLMGSTRITDEIKPFISDRQIVIRASGKAARPYMINSDKQYDHDTESSFRGGVISISGIARPERFETMLNKLKYNVLDNIRLDDHHDYTLNDMTMLEEKCKEHNCYRLITTEKDAGKLQKFKEYFETANIEIAVIPIYLKIVKNFKPLGGKLRKVLNTKPRKVLPKKTNYDKNKQSSGNKNRNYKSDNPKRKYNKNNRKTWNKKPQQKRNPE